MLVLRMICGVLFAILAIYTAITISRDGMDLVTPFFSDILSLTWPGQFNVDFSSYLVLGTIWFVWRNDGATLSLVLAPVVLTGGMLVLAAYLIWLSYRVDARMDVLFLGRRRARSMS